MANGMYLVNNYQRIWKIKHRDPAFVILCLKFSASTRSVEMNHDRFFRGAPDINLSSYGSALRGSRLAKHRGCEKERSCEKGRGC